MRWLSAIFIVGVLARVLGQLLLDAYAHPQIFEYQEIATNLLGGRGYTYASPDGGIYVASQSSPLYILLTAGIYAVTSSSQVAMLLLQAVLGGVTAALAAWLGDRVFSRAAGMIAGLLVAVDPALVVYASELHSLTLDALANLALVCASIALPNRPDARRLGAVGTLFGVSALTRSTALILLPLHVLWLRKSRALITFGSLVMIGVAVLVYAPWPVRNTLLLGQLTLGSSETTEWLWRGNNPNANGGSLTPDGERMLDRAPAEFRARVEAADEAQRMIIYGDAAASFITSDPPAAIRLYVGKLGGFWWGYDSTGELYPDLWLMTYRAWYLMICCAALLGIWRSAANACERPPMVLIITSLATISLTQAAFYVEGRHRIAVEPLILLLSGAGLAWLLMRIRVRSRVRADVLANIGFAGIRDEA